MLLAQAGHTGYWEGKMILPDGREQDISIYIQPDRQQDIQRGCGERENLQGWVSEEGLSGNSASVEGVLHFDNSILMGISQGKLPTGQPGYERSYQLIYNPRKQVMEGFWEREIDGKRVTGKMLLNKSRKKAGA